MAETFTFTIKPIADLSDVRANVGEIQRAFSKLKLPPKLGVNLSNELHNFITAYDKFTEKQNKGIKNNSDVSSLMKASDSMLSSYKKISEIMKQVDNSTIANVFKLEGEEVEKFQQKLVTALQNLSKYQSQLDNFKFKGTDKILDDISKLEKKTRSTDVKGYLANLKIGIEKEDFDHAKNAIDELKAAANSSDIKLSSNTKSSINELVAAIEPAVNKFMNLREKAEKASQVVKEIDGKPVEAFSRYLEQGNEALEKNAVNAEKAAKEQANLNKQVSRLESQVEAYFGLNAIFRKVATMARDAMNTVKELDKAMTETAVVTDFSVADMWEKLPIYTAEANKLGSSIKDVYEATTLYYQQGLNTTQSMGLAVETLKMARIAGMDAKDATDAMTAALRGFNLELNQASAQRINDVYSELAAITASDTQEISTAMEKVASLAHNAGMEVETTSAFLAQMIETTREAPENLGTALKTVVARFQEMKQDPTKLIDSEGVMLDANKVDKALKSIGINLTDANGEFRKLDDVFLEIASRWDSLSKGQQRYIATMAAGSRQQSRFIAMMSNYERTMELVDAANNAAGASQKQFEKTLESMDTKLTQLNNAWNQFTMGLMNNEILKAAVDFGTGFLDTINRIINAISGGNGLIKSIITLGATFGGLTGARTILNAGIGGGFKWFKGELDTKGLFASVLLSGRRNIQEQFSKAGIVSADNFEKSFRGRFQKNYQQGFQYSLHNLSNSIFKDAVFNKVPVKFDEEQIRQNLIKAVNANGGDQVAINSLKVMGKESLTDYAKRNNFVEALGPTEEAVKSFEKLNTAAGKFAVGTTKAGSALQSFGLLLRGTPLAPFGMALQVAGSSLSSFGQLFVQVGKNGEILNTGLAAVKANLAGFVPYIAIFAALAAAITVVYFAVTENKRRLEALSKVAQDASNNLDTLKQNATEFKGSLEEIRANKDAFKDLVPGTLEFNEKLVESNQLILDLINKYEELKGKLQVDEFGRYFIADDDLNEFYKTLQNRQQIGQSLSLLTDFAVTEEKAKQEISKINDSYQEILHPKYGHDNDEGVPIPSKEDLYKEADNIAYAKASEEAEKEIAEKQRELEIQKQATYSAAIQGAIAGLDIDNSSTANILAQQYQKYLKDVGELTTEEAIEIYARQNNLSTAEVTSDKDLKNFAIKEAPTIKALQNIYDNAEKVDNILESVDQNVYSAFGEKFGDNKTFFTDLFGRNELTDTELLRQFNLNGDWVTKMVDSLSDEMVLEFEPEFDEESIDEARTQLEEDLVQAGQDLLEIQKPIYTDFATLYMRSGAASKANSDKFGKVTALYEASAFRESIEEDLKQISVEKAKFITEVASELETHVGNDVTAEFMRNAVSIYSSGVSTRIQELETILTGVSWDSAISRLEAYDAMIDSEDEEIHQFGESLYGAAEEANLLGEAVYEAFSSESFQELYQKRDDYVNSFGKFDAAGIKKMQTESSVLTRLLDTGKISANGLATALNTLDDTGSLDGLTSAVLELISEFDSLGEVMSDAHDIVSNFDPGIDTGEGEDFVKKNYEAVKEYWDNYEVGNEQLINYLKLYAGEDRWNKLSQKYNGNLEKIERAILNGDKNHSAMSLFAEGFEEAWIKGANQGYSKNGISLSRNGDFVDLDIGDKTTDEVVTWLQDVYGISEEYAKLMLTDFENYSADLRRDLARNDWNNALPDFINKKTRENGTTLLTQEEVNTIASARGISTEQVIKELRGKTSDLRIFDMNKYQDTEGNIDYAKAFQGWLDRTVGSRNDNNKIEKNSGDISDYLEETGDKVNELAGAVTDMQSSGIPLSDTQEMLYSKVAGTDGQYTYKGVELTDKDTKTLDNFVNKMAEIDQDEQWTKVGNAICRGWFEEYDKRNNKGVSEQDSSKSQPVMATTDTNTSDGSHTKEVDITIDKTVNEEVNTVENYDENGSNTKREVAIRKEKELKEIVEYAKEENIDVIEAAGKITSLEKQQDSLKREIARKKALGLDTTDAEISLSNVNNKLQTVKNRLEEIREKRKITLEITTEGSIPRGEVQYGHNNYISSTGFYAGSAASGRHGTVGPKNKGGLTLTGEKGFEIAWIPSENRSMILGAQGPQLANLPADTVVYTHEQSKKIVKQKGIPAGSHDEKSSRKIHKPKSSSGSGSNNNNNNNNNTEKSKKSQKPHTNWLDIEIDRYNLSQKINSITEKIEKQTKEIDKALEKVGTTYSDISKATKEQLKSIKSGIKAQEKLKETYEQGLEDLNNGNRKLWISVQTQNDKGEYESKEKSINVSKYINEKNGTYSINKKAITKDYSLKANQEAVFNAIQSELDKLTSGANSAAKAIDDLNDKREQLTKNLAETFYLWENELTKTYKLANRVADAEANRGRYEAQMASYMAQLESGYIDTESAIKSLNKFRDLNNKELKRSIEGQYELLESQRKDLASALDFNAQIKAAYKTLHSSKANEAQKKAAQQQYDKAKLASKYISSEQLKDGSFRINLDTKQIEKDRKAGNLSEQDYQIIKDIYDATIDLRDESKSTETELIEAQTAVYEELAQYQQDMVSLEGDLIKALEDAAMKEVNKLESLNTSLTNATKSIIEQVKKSIDARRRSEDNAKTEADISRKQQRLAALRANTAGGNQTEIAQLEKEIADAQQSYGRTLEDQLLNDIQAQGDEAARQRQLQIDIAKQQIEWNKATGEYARQADELLTDVKGNAETIKEILQDTDKSKGTYQQAIDDSELNKKIAEGVIAQEGIAANEAMLASDWFTSIQADVAEMTANSREKAESTAKEKRKAANAANKEIAAVKEDNSKNLTKAKNEKSKAQETVAKAEKALQVAQRSGDSTAINNAKIELNKAKAGLSEAQSNLAQVKAENKSNLSEIKELYGNDTHAKGKLKSLPAEKLTKKSDIKKLQEGLNDLIDDGQITGVSKISNPQGKGGPKTQAAVKALQKKLGRKETGEWNKKTAEDLRKHKRLKYYATGGLANYTGPAWLDGTPSKPELVLNAQDTKNFMALKDILSGAIRSINHVDSTNNYNSPTEVNINVNVDKIANDYDVDKLTERIKKNIVKDASYRNVTSVRNLR